MRAVCDVSSIVVIIGGQGLHKIGGGTWITKLKSEPRVHPGVFAFSLLPVPLVLLPT